MTFFRLPGRHQVTLDELHLLMQRFPRSIADMNALESQFPEYQETPDDESPAYFDKDDNLMRNDYIWHEIS